LGTCSSLAEPNARPRGRRTPPPVRKRWPRPVLICGPMHREDPQLVSRARGALLGLVAGNQLGVPTEHLGTPEAIRKSFPNGVVDLAPPPKNSPYDDDAAMALDRKSTRLNSSHVAISYAVFCLKKKKFTNCLGRRSSQ